MVRRSLLAQQDFRNIWHYIAIDNPTAADRLLRRIDSKVELYAANPNMGRPRDKLATGLRSFPVGDFVVFYRIVGDGIELVRIMHGARRMNDLFAP
jgi:toxin ParE1/3/4